MPHCESAHGIAVDAASHQLFATCKNAAMEVFDTRTGRIVAEPAIGKGTDSAAYDPVRKRAFSSNGIDGDISVIQQTAAGGFTPLAPVKTAPGAKTMAVDPQTGRLFVAAIDMETSDAGVRPKSGSLRLMLLDPVR